MHMQIDIKRIQKINIDIKLDIKFRPITDLCICFRFMQSAYHNNNSNANDNNNDNYDKDNNNYNDSDENYKNNNEYNKK